MVTRVGGDDDGRSIIELMEERDVDTSFVEIDDRHSTGRVTVNLLGDDHSFTIEPDAAWDFIEGPGSLPRHDLFCYGSLAGRSDRSLATLRRLLPAAGPFRALDVNLRPGGDVRASLETGLDNAALVKAGGDEFEDVSRAMNVEAETQAWFSTYPRLDWIAITRGSEGAELHGRTGERWRAPGKPVEVVDAVGAGDAFFSALVDSLARGAGGRAALDAAQHAARQIVRQRGGLPPGP